MDNVKRFEPTSDRGEGRCVEDPKGDYVEYDDYLTVSTRLAEVEDECGDLKISLTHTDKAVQIYHDLAEKMEGVAELRRQSIVLLTERIVNLERKLRIADVSVEAMSEIKAVVDGLSEQSTKDIVYGALTQIAELSNSKGSDG